MMQGAHPVVTAGQRADKLYGAEQQQHETQALPQLAPAANISRKPCECAQPDAAANGQRAPQQHADSRRQNPLQHPYGSASRPTPNTALTASIQAPLRGRSLPADVPHMTSGMPIPMAMANRAKPPRMASPVWPM